MKILFSTIFIFLLGSVFLLAQPKPEKISITVSSGKINFGKKNDIADGWMLEKAIRYLGSADRVSEGSNTTHTFDDFGIVLYESNIDKTPSGKVSEIQVHFSMPEPNNVTPKTEFTGRLSIDKLKVNSSTTLEEVRSKLKGYSESKSYLEHSYRLAKNGIYFYFQFDNDETQMVKVSFGQDKRTNN